MHLNHFAPLFLKVDLEYLKCSSIIFLLLCNSFDPLFLKSFGSTFPKGGFIISIIYINERRISYL